MTYELGDPGAEILRSWPLSDEAEAKLLEAAADDDLEQAAFLLLSSTRADLGIQPLDSQGLGELEQTDADEFQERLTQLGLLPAAAIRG
jgi:hypothetical protein